MKDKTPNPQPVEGFQSQPRVLAYAAPAFPQPHKPSFWLAVQLACPGLICWVCFFSLLKIGGPASNLLMAIAALALWPAIICAAVSLVAFIRFRRTAYPWYVVLNLTINISGLAFGFQDCVLSFYQHVRAVYEFAFQYWI